MKERLRDATPLFAPNGAADFTYRCDPFAGRGFFLVGDAAAFLDPVWSTGVSLGIIGGQQAARAIEGIIKFGSAPNEARRDYRAWVERNTSTAFRMIHAFYDRRFRDYLLSERRPLGLDRAVVTLLAGEFDPIPWPARWRWAALERLARTNVGARRIRPFSLAKAANMSNLARPVGAKA
jgi:2-polyprenyl-6-methoxyphenol hydroxylase-like FAD-dependent oxidoreductase